MKISTEPMGEVLCDLLNGLNHVGTKRPVPNTKPNTGALGALKMRLKCKLVQLFN